MKASIAVRSRLSGEAERLMREWEKTVADLGPGPVGEVMTDFVAVVAAQLRSGNAGAMCSTHRTPSGSIVQIIECPPLMELALREVIAVIASKVHERRKVERIVDMTVLLLGES